MSDFVRRSDIINTLADHIRAQKYLEIGICKGATFRVINIDYKVGVDVKKQSNYVTHETTSDNYFQNICNEKFDIIFIDGLHHQDQVYRDIINSLDVLNDGGYIICHDMKPLKEIHQVIPAPPIEKGKPYVWTGDCWKAWVKLRQERSDLEMFVVNTDLGCGVIRKGHQPKLECSYELNWSTFEQHNKELLNLISTDDFLKMYKRTKGVMYVVTGVDPIKSQGRRDGGVYYLKQFLKSLQTLKEVSTLPVTLFTHHETYNIIPEYYKKLIDQVIWLDEYFENIPDEIVWGTMPVCEPKLKALTMLPYDINLYVDTDTAFYQDPRAILTSNYDIGICYETRFGDRAEIEPIHTSYNAGIICVTKNKRSEKFINFWYRRYNELKQLYHDNKKTDYFKFRGDQSVLNKLRCEYTDDIFFSVLPYKWNVRSWENMNNKSLPTPAIVHSHWVHETIDLHTPFP